MRDEKHAVLEIERARVEALLRHDVAALDRMMAEECVHTESNGTLRTKAQFLAAFAAQEFTFASFILDANEVRLYGDTAVIVGSYRNVIRTGGRLLSEKTQKCTGAASARCTRAQNLRRFPQKNVLSQDVEAGRIRISQ